MNTVSSPATPITLSEGFFSRRSWWDWLFAALVLLGGITVMVRYGSNLDG